MLEIKKFDEIFLRDFLEDFYKKIRKHLFIEIILILIIIAFIGFLIVCFIDLSDIHASLKYFL